MKTQYTVGYEEKAWDITHNVLKTTAFETDQTNSFPIQAMRALGRSGLMGLLVPKQYGGLGGAIYDFTRITEILAQGCTSVAALFFFHGQVAKRIADFGSEPQKKSILPKLATGSWMGASSWSELQAGADKGLLQTSAVRRGDSLIINGQKAYCTGAGEADIYTVLVRMDVNGIQELSFLLLQKEDVGVHFGSVWNGMGLRGSSTKEIVCEEVVVPLQRLLGEPGIGKKIMSTNRTTAIHPGILGLGIAKAAMSILEEQLREKGHLWGYQHTRTLVSDLLVQLHSLELLTYQAARLADQNNHQSAQMAMESKILAAKVCSHITDAVMHVCGANGYAIGHPIERLYRDAKAIGIMGPTTELCREYVATDWWKEVSENSD